MPISVTNSASGAGATALDSRAGETSDLHSAYEAECTKRQVNRDDQRQRDGATISRKRAKSAATLQGNLFCTAVHQLREQSVMRQLGAAGRRKLVVDREVSGPREQDDAVQTTVPLLCKRILSNRTASKSPVADLTQKAAASNAQKAARASETGEMEGEAACLTDLGSRASATKTRVGISADAPRDSTTNEHAAMAKETVGMKDEPGRATDQGTWASATKTQVGISADVAQDSTTHKSGTPIIPAMAPAVLMSAAAPAVPRTNQRTQAAVSRAMAAAAASEASPTDDASLHYSFRTWQEQPRVELRFDSSLVAGAMTAHASHDRVTAAMQQHAGLLPGDVALRFDRQHADEHGQDASGSNEQQEADEE